MTFDDESESDKDSGNDFTFGVGAQYTVGQVTFRTEVERFKLDDQDVDMVSAGIAYNF